MTLMFLAASENKKNGIEKISYLRNYMKENNLVPNQKTYGSMIYAYGRQNALEEAFSVADEMIANKMKLEIHIYNNLLKACLSVKFGGFQQALFVSIFFVK
jgi:pentatricopeptide repeat protein